MGNNNSAGTAKTAAAPAYAKVNLFLEVLGKRGDGYHDIVTVMQRISLCDSVSVALTDGGIGVVCDREELSGKNNIAFSAAESFFAAANIRGGAFISIKKRIPVKAGLGGGSSDAGTVLVLLNDLCGRPLSAEELRKVGFSVGADVPFFTAGCSAALVEGAGERVTPVDGLKNCFFTVVMSGEKRSTRDMYDRLDGTERTAAPHADMLGALKRGDPAEAGKNLYNAFERVGGADPAVYAAIRRRGPLGVLLCGSGPGVFALCGDRASADGIAGLPELRGAGTFVAEPC